MTTTTAGGTNAPLDPRRWITLFVVVTAMFISSLDTTMLNVAIPSMVRDFDAGLASVQWVIAGYALAFASLLIIGGRIGDIFGHRRVFLVGTTLFGIGSLLGSVSPSLGGLILGQAVIKGIGAAMMVPNSLAITSRTFHGRERATAFGVWGAASGVAGVLGPVVGGFLTTNYSWRWSLRINIFIAPLVIIGALLFTVKTPRERERPPIDALGALLVASSLFLLVFALSRSALYGWWEQLSPLTVGGRTLWSASVSVVPVAIAVAVVLMAVFWRVEVGKERRSQSPIFEFGQLRHRGFRYGLAATILMSVGQFALILVVPVFLQNAKHLSAQRTGLWMLPIGAFVIVSAQLGSRWSRRTDIVTIVKAGFLIEALGILWVAVTIRPEVGFLTVAPGLALFGIGVGFASAQITNVVLADVDNDKAGVASGAATVVRQMGNALGVAMIGSLLTSLTIRHAVGALNATDRIPDSLRRSALRGVRDVGSNYVPPAGTPDADARFLDHAVASGTATAARYALVVAAVVLALALAFAFLLPRDRAARSGAGRRLTWSRRVRSAPEVVGVVDAVG